VIATVALTDLVVSVSEVAVIVTVPPVGTEAGAVYVVLTGAEPTLVIVGLNDPQAVDPQVAVQIMPPLTGSFVTEAKRPAVVLISIELGTGVEVENDIAIGVDSTVKLTLLV